MVVSSNPTKRHSRDSAFGVLTFVHEMPNWLLAALIMSACWGTLVAYYHFKFDLSAPPAASGDEPDYDSMGWELANGRGFRVNSSDPAFRRPYDLAAAHDNLYQLPQSRTDWDTTRPPLYPLAISLLDRIFGRQLWATRVMDAWFIAASCAILVMWTRHRFGILLASASLVLFFLVDVRTRLYGRAILTEAMSMFFVTLLSVAIMRFWESDRSATRHCSVWSAGLGLMTGLCILVRSLMILWLPGLCILLMLAFWVKCRSWIPSVLCVAWYLLVTTLTLLPWGIRNVTVTGEMMPLGTQGLVQSSAAFSDQAWEARGLWRNLDQDGFFDSVLNDSQTLVESEVAKANFSRKQAMQWITANPGKAAMLFPIKIAQEFRPRNLTELLILILAGIGIPAACCSVDGRILLALLAINAFSIGVTWSVEGRFLVPVLFALHALAIFGVVTLKWMIVGSENENFAGSPTQTCDPVPAT